MKLKTYLLIFVSSLFLCLVLAPLGGDGPHLRLLGAALLYFAATLFFLQRAGSRRERWIAALLMALPPLLLFLPQHLEEFENTLISFPAFLAHFVGIAFALATQATRGRGKYAVAAVLLVAAPFAAFKGYAFWLHQLSFGTFTGHTSYPAPAPISGVLQDGQRFTKESLRGKVVVLDFWHTQCGVCFQKFPQVQKLYDQYKGAPSFVLLAVNKPIESDSVGKAFAMLQQRGYTFPVLVPSDSRLPEAFGVTFYPTTVVMDTAGVVVFRGSLERAVPVIEGLMGSGR